MWQHQIQAVLDHVVGEKIVYGFSGPSLAGFCACKGRKDIKKYICDGGPFTQLYNNTKSYFYEDLRIRNPWLNSVTAYLGTALWGGKRGLKNLNTTLLQWPKNIPILSIRGVEDPIVAIETIDEIFSPHPHLDLKVLELPYGKHLDGLKEFPEKYTQTLLPFIKQDL